MPVMVVPVPLLQLLPPSRLNCQVAPFSRPDTFTVLVLVILSDALVPLSFASASVGVDTTVSTVSVSAALLALSLPAASVKV